LFAAADIAVGEVILRMSPHHFSVERFHPWNGEDMGTIPFFINHSCDANSLLVFSDAEWKMQLRAVKFIPANAEVTLDYALVEVGGEFIPCNCRAVNCRGTFPVNRKQVH
jgi:hypothetical protein